MPKLNKQLRLQQVSMISRFWYTLSVVLMLISENGWPCETPFVRWSPEARSSSLSTNTSSIPPPPRPKLTAEPRQRRTRGSSIYHCATEHAPHAAPGSFVGLATSNANQTSLTSVLHLSRGTHRPLPAHILPSLANRPQISRTF
jgi:hypothetical protein